MEETLPDDTLEALRSLSTCAAANALETLNIRLRNEGFSDGTVRSLFDGQPVLGYAVTVRIRCSSPPTGPGYLERTEWWNHVLSVPAPRLVVIEDADPMPGTGALIGEVHSHILKALGCVGVITNGAVRDLPAVRKLGFQLFAGRVAVSHAYAHIVAMDETVKVAGLEISPGDLLHADGHGFIAIPRAHAAEIPAIALRMAEAERQLIRLCQEDPFSMEALRSAIRELRRPPGGPQGA